MFKKALQDLDSRLSSKINELSKKIDDLFAYICRRDKDRDLLYVMHLKSDIDCIAAEDNTHLYQIGKDLNEISVFIRYNEATDELVALFIEIIEKYKDRYYTCHGFLPANYDYWFNVIKAYEGELNESC